MIPAINAEIRKVLTTRSTYITSAISFLLGVVLVGFFVYGYRNVANADTSSRALLTALSGTLNVLSAVILAFVAIFSVGYEYRYGTIAYSLTSTNQRLKIFFAKWLVLCVFTLAVAALIVLGGWVAFILGQHGAHITTTTQYGPGWDFFWRAGTTVLAYTSIAFLITILLRSLVAAFTIFLVLPLLVEPIVGLLLKDNAKYLPFTAISAITDNSTSHVPPTHSLGIVALYVAILAVVSAVIFVERDTN